MVNISRKALVETKKQAKTLFAMTEEQIKAALEAGVFKEIEEDYHENKYWDDFLVSLHKTAEGLHKIGVINDA
jgi:hypothetical protein